MKRVEVRRLARKALMLGFLLICLAFANAGRGHARVCCSVCPDFYTQCVSDCDIPPPPLDPCGCKHVLLVCERTCDPSC
jgi:hypothetical protein